MAKGRTNDLHGIAQFALFVSSYSPLFVLIIIKQLTLNIDYLNWAGFNKAGLSLFLSKFGLSIFLSLVAAIGWIGLYSTLRNIEVVAKNGFPITLKSVSNKNNESIGYIATYIIPFLFQGFNTFYECFSVIFLLAIIYRIYINSSLLLVNPLLSINYAIYEIEYDSNNKSRKALVISRDKYLNDDADIKLYEIGHKLFFAINNE